MGPTRMTQNNLAISGASAETHPQSPFCHVRSHVLGFQGRGRGSLWGPPFCPPQPVRRGPWVCSDRARPEQSGSWGGEPAGAPSPPPCVTRSQARSVFPPPLQPPALPGASPGDLEPAVHARELYCLSFPPCCKLPDQGGGTWELIQESDGDHADIQPPGPACGRLQEEVCTHPWPFLGAGPNSR